MPLFSSKSKILRYSPIIVAAAACGALLAGNARADFTVITNTQTLSNSFGASLVYPDPDDPSQLPVSTSGSGTITTPNVLSSNSLTTYTLGPAVSAGYPTGSPNVNTFVPTLTSSAPGDSGGSGYNLNSDDPASGNPGSADPSGAGALVGTQQATEPASAFPGSIQGSIFVDDVIANGGGSTNYNVAASTTMQRSVVLSVSMDTLVKITGSVSGNAGVDPLVSETTGLYQSTLEIVNNNPDDPLSPYFDSGILTPEPTADPTFDTYDFNYSFTMPAGSTLTITADMIADGQADGSISDPYGYVASQPYAAFDVEFAPEPGTLGLLALGGFALLGRKRK